MLNRSTLHAPHVGFSNHEMVGGIRRFHLVAQVVEQELVKGIRIKAWGYNGSTPGPVIVVHEGERVQIVLHNRLSKPTSIHWHGIIVPNQMDGVPDLGGGPLVKPGESFIYDFVIQQSGTYLYHAHAHDPMEELMGLAGMIVALPRQPFKSTVDHEYLFLLQEWSVKEAMQNQSMPMGRMQNEINHAQMGGMEQNASGQTGVLEIDPMSMDFNYFTMNGKAFPDIAPIPVRYGERIRFRLGNLSMNSHPMHLHGHYFLVTRTDGTPLYQPFYKNTINVAPGETWDIEFTANNPGVWAFHCHKPHHMSNRHQPTMGGMFAIVKYE